jgi:membrane dipeptidase
LSSSPRPTELAIFDGHNDVLSALLEAERHAGATVDATAPRKSVRNFFERGEQGHIDLPRAHAGGFGGGLFSVYVSADPFAAPSATAPFPRPLDLAFAQRTALAEIGLLYRLERQSEGQLKICTRRGDVRASIEHGVLAAVIHMEGAEPIDPRLDLLDAYYAAGLRSVGPVWSRRNDFGEGVPYLFPHSPDTGPGLTDLGKELVRQCLRLGMIVDVSHINERGFWDIAELTDKPIVATHSNVHALCPSPRNLTDRQLDAIGESDGIVGVNFYTGFLREDGKRDPDTPISRIVEHVDYIARRIGIEHVGFGADMDGALMPAGVPDVAALPGVLDALRAAGYDDTALKKITHGNWLRVIESTWTGRDEA